MLIYQSVRKIPVVLSTNGTTSVKLILPSVVRDLFYWVNSATKLADQRIKSAATNSGNDRGLGQRSKNL